MPGLAPWESFTETHLTFSCAAFSRNICGSKRPSLMRAPK